EIDGLEEPRVRRALGEQEAGGGNTEPLACDEQQPVRIELAPRDRDEAAALEPELVYGANEPSEVAMELRIGDLASAIDDGDPVRRLGRMERDVISRVGTAAPFIHRRVSWRPRNRKTTRLAQDLHPRRRRFHATMVQCTHEASANPSSGLALHGG